MSDLGTQIRIHDAGLGSTGLVSNATAEPCAEPSSIRPCEVPRDSEEDTEEMAISPLSDEDAQSLIELSMSRAATRLKSPATSAIEKATAMEDLDAGGSFDSDVETPPGAAEDGPVEAPLPESPNSEREPSSSGTDVPGLGSKIGETSLERLPAPNLEEPTHPTLWHPGPKQLAIGPKDNTHLSAMAAVFGGNNSTRSPSAGAEALRKLLPKGLPSMAQVGHLFGSSSNSNHKTRSGESATFPIESSVSQSHLSVSSFTSGDSPQVTSQPRTSEPLLTVRPQVTRHPNSARPPNLRRSTSDDSLLYHSLSRASSLGDDTRFENHREQVNSRVKAIRDSLQDRSSFRMPHMPHMPSLPSIPNILPGTVAKRKSSVAAPTVTPGMVDAAVPRPEAAMDTSRQVVDVPSSTFLDRAMENLTGDVVIMGGYRGSILRSTKSNRQIWIPVKVGLNIRKVNLEVGLEPEDEERMPETIYPSGMLQNIGPVDISKRLFKRLSESENARNGKLRVWDYGYDWRLSPHLLSRQLQKFLEGLPSNSQDGVGSAGGGRGALVIAHSLGGLITRHVVNQRPELFSGVIYAGVPQSCINILGPLRNGDAVLLSSRVLTAQVNFTLRTSFVLLPEDGACFVDIKTKEKYPVDFFNLDDWIKYRLSPCTDPPLPPKNPPVGAFGGLLNRPGSLLNLPMHARKSISGPSSTTAANYSSHVDAAEDSQRSPSPTKTSRAADAIRGMEGGTDRTLAPQMAGMGSNSNPVSKGQSTNSSVSTAVTIPRDKAIVYLERTLRETKKFKQELYFNPKHSASNAYPPLALIYGKSIPTCSGAKVDGIDSIPCADVYDNLAFASGDGVCLAKQAMLPEGYKTVYGGRIKSDRGHVTLLGDLNAVGRAIEAVLKGRAKGIGKGDGWIARSESILT
ncbi:hypothetical protein QTJ16_000963 [Diplocarpon rosae]|uniref:Uncharacterized protein n=1 Tax=Diplocarpon rosae TaxID=946125 RepID=A0AAD9T534_9HELO|nr:hypothetical protein QTJ16_000963 [Diplocarpon rosae]